MTPQSLLLGPELFGRGPLRDLGQRRFVGLGVLAFPAEKAELAPRGVAVFARRALHALLEAGHQLRAVPGQRVERAGLRNNFV